MTTTIAAFFFACTCTPSRNTNSIRLYGQCLPDKQPKKCQKQIVTNQALVEIDSNTEKEKKIVNESENKQMAGKVNISFFYLQKLLDTFWRLNKITHFCFTCDWEYLNM